jgi:hypothetical protein
LFLDRTAANSILVSGTVMKADFGRQGYLVSIEEGENTVRDPQPIRSPGYNLVGGRPFFVTGINRAGCARLDRRAVGRTSVDAS